MDGGGQGLPAELDGADLAGLVWVKVSVCRG